MDIATILKAKLRSKIVVEESRIQKLKNGNWHLGKSFEETIYSTRIDTYKVMIDEINDIEHKTKDEYEN